MLFGPRWVYATPALVLTPLALALRRRLLWPIGLALVVVLVPIMGFCFPWARLAAATGPRLRVLTYNVNCGAVGREEMAGLLAQVQPDVVDLQECPTGFYDAVFRGWHVCAEGELFTASRYPIRRRDAMAGLHPPHTWPRQSMLLVSVEGPFGEIGLCNVHLPSPRYGLCEVLDRHRLIAPERTALLERETTNREDQSAAIEQAAAGLLPDVIVGGDFNMPTDSTIYRRDWSRYSNAFSSSGLGFGYTILSPYRGCPFGVRIDHVLCGASWAPARAWVGPDVGSDHLPLIADLRRR
jgi:endonuclease/exonuclease/phosphatase (EEP) superfamily protein YafD